MNLDSWIDLALTTALALLAMIGWARCVWLSVECDTARQRLAESQAASGVRLAAFLKQVESWPQPEAWYDPDDEGFVVDWSRDQNHFASVFFRDNSPVVRWGICTRGRHEVGCGQEITEVVMGRIKAIAVDE